MGDSFDGRRDFSCILGDYILYVGEEIKSLHRVSILERPQCEAERVGTSYTPTLPFRDFKKNLKLLKGK